MFKMRKFLSTVVMLAILVTAVYMPNAVAAQSVPDCGTEPVTLNAYFETGFDIPFKLAEEFTKQYPNVTWDIKQDQFTNLINSTPRLLSGDNPPDLIRLPTMVSFAEQGLLKNLDDYASAFGWNEWPVPQLNQNRVAEDGTRGSGSLYAICLLYTSDAADDLPCVDLGGRSITKKKKQKNNTTLYQ